MKFLSDEQRRTLLGMGRYWEEVAKREDTSPLVFELRYVYRMLGTTLLWIVLDCAAREEADDDG
jgi:hypothetical protein